MAGACSKARNSLCDVERNCNENGFGDVEMIDDKELEKLAQHKLGGPSDWDVGAVYGFKAGYRASEAKALERIERLRSALEALVGHSTAKVQFPHKDSNDLKVAIMEAKDLLKDGGNE